jgi:hypothetical protein
MQACVEEGRRDALVSATLRGGRLVDRSTQAPCRVGMPAFAQEFRQVAQLRCRQADVHADPDVRLQLGFDARHRGQRSHRGELAAAGGRDRWALRSSGHLLRSRSSP